MRKTKIICTIGPSCDNEETLTAMCLAGMNVARLNFSHGDHEEHQRKIDLLKKVREKLNLPIAILIDTKGPEYRIKTFKDGKVQLNHDDIFSFMTTDVEGDNTRVSVTYKGMAADLSTGDTILLSNGLLSFEVLETTKTEVKCKVVNGGVLSDRKSMSFPNKVLKQKYLGEQDKSDLIFGIKNDIDFVACSFVSCKQDLLDVKNFLEEQLGDTWHGVEFISKIENQAGVDNIDSICEECSGIMIGRGDLGVEIPFHELPAVQKHLITKCRMLGKRVITATEMLESMITNPRPTRAETSDVANAVYDGTSCIMLSGETAAGKYPVQAVETMALIAHYTEKNIHYNNRFKNTNFQISDTVDAFSHAICGMSIDVDAKAIVVCSLSGMTARMVSRFRSPVNILGLTADKKTWYKLAMSWGVTPTMSERYDSTDVLFYAAKQLAKETFNLEKGDKIVISGGMTNGESGNTNVLKLEVI